jgi:hypothetical protein
VGQLQGRDHPTFKELSLEDISFSVFALVQGFSSLYGFGF